MHIYHIYLYRQKPYTHDGDREGGGGEVFGHGMKIDIVGISFEPYRGDKSIMLKLNMQTEV